MRVWRWWGARDRTFLLWRRLRGRLTAVARIIARVDSRDLARIQRRFRELPDRITEGAQEAVKESGETVREKVARNVRVWRGRLRDRVRVRFVGALGLTADVGWFDEDTYYAQFQEFGTSSITADPVLTRAGIEEENEFPRRLQRHIEDRL